VATKVRAIAAKTGERACTAAPLNQWTTEKATISTGVQIKVLTDLVRSLLKAMEEQKQTHQNQIEALTKTHQNQIEAITKTHQNQIEAITKTVTQQIDTLKGEMAAMTEQIQTKLSAWRSAARANCRSNAPDGSHRRQTRGWIRRDVGPTRLSRRSCPPGCAHRR
jgi:DNA anti-recombination protein RmuC